MCRKCLLLAAAVLVLPGRSSQEPKPRQPDPPKVGRTLVRGSSRYVNDLVRVVGRVTVIDAHTLRYDDGTEVDLLGGMDAPDLDQMARLGDKMYPLGREAAAFVRKQIGEKPVTCFIPTDRDDWARQTKFRQGQAFVGETCLNDELVRNGWATAHHTGMESWEALARLNKRGLWRGEFVPPEKWRKGERLPGEK
jgi:endonuclease YncB( thermonuclease family)